MYSKVLEVTWLEVSAGKTTRCRVVSSCWRWCGVALGERREVSEWRRAWSRSTRTKIPDVNAKPKERLRTMGEVLFGSEDEVWRSRLRGEVVILRKWN